MALGSKDPKKKKPQTPAPTITVGAFDPGTDYTSGGGTVGGGTVTGGGGTTNKVTESISEPSVGNDFSLFGGMSGLRSPDAIDQPNNYLTITNSVGVQDLPAEQMSMLQAQLKQAGLTPQGFQISGTLDSDTQKALLELKRVAQSSGMSDMDALRTRIEQAALAASGAYGGTVADGTKAGTTTSTTITDPVFTDPLTARNVLLGAVQDRVGRAPTADEYHQFRKMLTNAEGGQDVVTNTVTSDGNGNVRQHVHKKDNTNDPSPQDVAQQFTSTGALGKEANTRDAGVTYYDALARLIGGQ